jgi:hypothetical protein
MNMVKTFWFHKTLENSWVTAQLEAFQEVLSSIELVMVYIISFKIGTKL